MRAQCPQLSASFAVRFCFVLVSVDNIHTERHISVSIYCFVMLYMEINILYCLFGVNNDLNNKFTPKNLEEVTVVSSSDFGKKWVAQSPEDEKRSHCIKILRLSKTKNKTCHTT